MNPKPKFLVACGCYIAQDGEEVFCGRAHVEPCMVAARCDECHEPATVQLSDTSFRCDGCANPCWKCNGVGCRACGDTGTEATRRILQNCAELPAFHVEEPTKVIPAETMAEAVLR